MSKNMHNNQMSNSHFRTMTFLFKLRDFLLLRRKILEEITKEGEKELKKFGIKI